MLKRLLLLFCCVTFSAFAYEKVPGEIVKALGTVRGKPISTGLVFVDGKYLKPPYRVSRVGNQIMLNDRYPVSGQLISWEKFLATQPPSNLKEIEVEDKSVPKEEPAAKPAPAEDGNDPAAPKDGGNTPPPADEDDGSARIVRIVETRYAADADDLEDFKPGETPEKMKLSDIPPDSEEDKKRQKRVEEEKKEEAEEEDEEEAKGKGEGEGGTESAPVDANGDDVDPASPEGEAAAKKAAAKAPPPPAKKMRKVTVLAGKFDMNFQAQKLVKPMDAYRAKFEATLRRGGYLFFGTGPKTYCVGRTSEAVATKELLKKLPELMAAANESEAFCDAVRSSGLMSYITYQIAQDLFRHKADSIFLKQRRREIAEDEKLNKMMKNVR